MTNVQRLMVNMIGLDYTETGNEKEIASQCPFCHESRKKLYISPSGKFICFICNTKGSGILSFVEQYYDCSAKEAKAILHDQNYDTVSSPILVNHSENESLLSKLIQIQEKQKVKVKQLVSPPIPTNWHNLINNMDNPEAYPYFNYLHGRGLTLEDIRDFDLGYVTNGVVKRKGKKDLRIQKSIMFPTYNQDGKLIYWSTRSIEAHPYVKSINAPATQDEISRKDILFNGSHVIKDNSYMVICEGPINAITSSINQLEYFGYVGVATLGKQVTDKQIELMKKLQPLKFLIFLDNDAKSQELDLIERMEAIDIPDNKIYLVKNPYGDKDANDLGRKAVYELLNYAKPVTMQDKIRLALESRASQMESKVS